MGTGWPAWASEPVRIVAPDPGWAVVARELADDVSRRLDPWLNGSVEHVGSTSVMGLAAKPIVDLMAPVRSVTGSDGADEPLAQSAWELVPPELDLRPWRRFYVLAQGTRRMAHLHLVEPTGRRWRETLAFRDVLRVQPALAHEYAELKKSAASSHSEDREAYTAAKTCFVRRVLNEHT